MNRKGISYIQGDIFDSVTPPLESSILIPHVCNNIGGFGSGFVVPLSKRWPKVKSNYLKWFEDGVWAGNNDCEKIPFSLGQTQILNVQDNVYVANMIAQHETFHTEKIPIRYSSLVRCMESVLGFLLKVKSPIIHCPMFGSDRAKGDWLFIEELIREIWTANKIEVKVFYRRIDKLDFVFREVME